MTKRSSDLSVFCVLAAMSAADELEIRRPLRRPMCASAQRAAALDIYALGEPEMKLYRAISARY